MILKVFEVSSTLFVAIAVLKGVFYWIGFGRDKGNALSNLNKDMNSN